MGKSAEALPGIQSMTQSCLYNLHSFLKNPLHNLAAVAEILFGCNENSLFLEPVCIMCNISELG